MKGGLILFLLLLLMLHSFSNLVVNLKLKATHSIFIFYFLIVLLNGSYRVKVGLFQEEFFTCNLIPFSQSKVDRMGRLRAMVFKRSLFHPAERNPEAVLHKLNAQTKPRFSDH